MGLVHADVPSGYVAGVGLVKALQWSAKVWLCNPLSESDPSCQAGVTPTNQ
jgi:hypothetical protein